jgi:putative transferase (TIGR04331 family)
LTNERLLLVTTALESTWGIGNERVLFLGEWCKLYDRKGHWSNIVSETVPYHWDDREKLYSDSRYLEKFYERTLENLAFQLNSIHRTAHNLRYWRILVGPWLSCFIQVLYDRWLSIQTALDMYDVTDTIVLETDAREMVPTGMMDFVQFSLDDRWNHHIYSLILDQFRHLNVIRCPSEMLCVPPKTAPKEHAHKKIKTLALSFFEAAAHIFARDSDAFLIETYLPALSSAQLHLRLGQFPQRWRSKTLEAASIIWQQRLWKMSESGGSNFEKFVLGMIPKQVPSAFLEGYSNLLAQARGLPWPKQPKVIFTANILWYDPVAMAYIAEKVENGSPLLYGQHGGVYGIAQFSCPEKHEVKISDRFLTWGWSEMSVTNAIPVGILKVGQKMREPSRKNSNLLFVTLNSYRYSFSLSSELACAERYFRRCFLFAASLDDQIKNNLLIRLAQDRGWHQSSRWRDRFPDIRLEDGKAQIFDLMKDAKLVVFSYNQTGFLEALALGIPAVLLSDFKTHPLRDSAVSFYEDLTHVGICHDTPESAANHVNAVWSNVNAWWLAAETQDVVNRFTKRYCRIEDNIVERVETIMHEVIGNPPLG